MAKKKFDQETEEIENIVNQKKERTPSQSAKATKKPASRSRQLEAPKSHTQAVTVKQKKEPKYERDDMDRPLHRTMPIILAAIAVFITISFIVNEESVGLIGKLLGSELLLGLFSSGAYFIPAFILMLAIFWRRDVRHHILAQRVVFSLFSLLLISMLFQIPILNKEGSIFNLARLYSDGKSGIGGGAIGGFIASALNKVIGVWGIVIITVAVCILFAIYFLGFTPQNIAAAIRKNVEKSREIKERRAEEIAKYEAEANSEEAVKPESAQPAANTKADEKPADSENVKQSSQTSSDVKHNIVRPTENSRNRKIFSPDNFVDEDTPLPADPDDTISASPVNPKMSKIDCMIDDDDERDIPPSKPISEQKGAIVLDAIVTREPAPDAKLAKVQPDVESATVNFGVTDAPGVPDAPKAKITPDMVVVKNLVGDGLDAGKFERTKGYRFPPVDLLNMPVEAASVDINQEIQANADKLLETLASFNVPTRITSISRGPRITRYELVPESGIRIRSISNLVDDISMNLATAGIRIEAPIPGKAAVGVEVPNRHPSTVYFRDLIDTKEFRSSHEKTTVCLGADVAGAPIFCDIAKTPHMLIAGATGMGKSVCINSVITSLLYKATPDEVKLILIDPKKVEFNVYRGVPHLLVPVVSDSKKAAGALSWAVNEMERRYDLIEELGVRNIKGYNEAIKGTNREFLPKIVIIIDELADLMMTSPDTVEESIQRITQKARAAGIHLIIGTQRPTTDVVTGTIKANIPSRIAFHVASQIDSRTILDMVGAEKLLNNGDMLFSLVGSSKPIRVQGAFIDDKEVDRVASFMRENNKGENNYSDAIMADIEREAEKCSQNGKKSAAALDAGEADDICNDPKLYSAIEVAVDCGKISTSLLQRKLSVGYGKAAKYIDYMESMGYVSPPDGMKPREVRITRQEYQEMMMNRDNKE